MTTRKAVPNNVEAEERVLSSILMAPQAISYVADKLRPEDFYHNNYADIYAAMLSLDNKRETIEGLAVESELERLSKHVDPMIFSKLYNAEINPDNIEYYARVIKETSQLRDAIRVAQVLVQDAYSLDPETIDKAMGALSLINQGRGMERNMLFDDALDALIPKIELTCERRKHGEVIGIPTGFDALDYLLGGLQPSDLITFAARPGGGKTSFALMLAYNVLVKSLTKAYRVQVFSMEMSTEQLTRRMLAIDSGVDQMKMRAGDLDANEWRAIRESHANLKKGRIWVDDTPALSISDLQNRARRYHQKHGLDLLIVDYMQLMKANNGHGREENRVQEVTKISNGLKELARELNVPVLALAQLNRAVEGRANKEPQLSDLRESGSIEQDSDVVMFIHREPDGIVTPTGHFVNIIIAKHRNGPTGVVPLHFKPSLTRFDNAEFNEEA